MLTEALCVYLCAQNAPYSLALVVCGAMAFGGQPKLGLQVLDLLLKLIPLVLALHGLFLQHSRTTTRHTDPAHKDAQNHDTARSSSSQTCSDQSKYNGGHGSHAFHFKYSLYMVRLGEAIYVQMLYLYDCVCADVCEVKWQCCFCVCKCVCVRVHSH